MPMPDHCIDCDKVAVVLDITVPYCPACYKKEKDRQGIERLTRNVAKRL